MVTVVLRWHRAKISLEVNYEKLLNRKMGEVKISGREIG